MRAERLTIAPEGGGRQAAETLFLDVNSGIIGDRRSAKDGSVSLLSGETEKEIRGLGGLCADRFMGNIVTQGLDYSLLMAGTRIEIGLCQLEVTRAGKRCFDTCALARSGEACPLPRSCAFARVLRGGEIRAGDELNFSGETPRI